MESTYAVLNGNLRTETDMTAIKGLSMPPQVLAQVKQMGMDRTISIYRSDKKLSYLIYPGTQGLLPNQPDGHAANRQDRPEQAGEHCDWQGNRGRPSLRQNQGHLYHR